MSFSSLISVRRATLSIVFQYGALLISLSNAFYTSSCLNCLLFFMLFAMYPRDVEQRVKADFAVEIYEPHSSYQVEPEQLPEHYVKRKLT